MRKEKRPAARNGDNVLSPVTRESDASSKKNSNLPASFMRTGRLLFFDL